MTLTFEPIGIVRSPFREKFAIPRQPRLAAVDAVIELLSPFDREETLQGLEQFSHLWVLFLFHATAGRGWRPTVRPPRLGGNRRVGVFATRSTHRPNPIGLSAVEYLGWQREAGTLQLRIRGADLLDGTPVLDLKPYLPYSDAIPDATAALAPAPPAADLEVTFSDQAETSLVAAAAARPELRRTLIAVLRHDPRPAYQRGDEDRVYGVRLYDYNVRFRVGQCQLEVIAIDHLGVTTAAE